MDSKEQSKRLGQIIAKAWDDDAFKQRLLKNATAVLKEEGFEVAANLEVRAVENTEKVFHLVIPPKPSSRELSDDQLQMVSGGILSGFGRYATPKHPDPLK